MTKTTNEPLVLCVLTVRKCFTVGQKENEKAFCLEFLWFDESLGNTQATYFCIVKTKDTDKKNSCKISYSNISSPIKPIIHSETLLILVSLTFTSYKDGVSEQGFQDGNKDQ